MPGPSQSLTQSCVNWTSPKLMTISWRISTMMPVEGARMPAVAMVIRAGGTARREAEGSSRPGRLEGDDDSLEVNYLYNCRDL